MSSLLEKYITRGWAVFPLRSGSKIPATEHGFKDATTDLDIVTLWATLPGPSYNWGIATGSVSGIVVVDVDIKNDGIANTAQLNLSPTYTVTTPSGGIHYYYAIPPGRPVRSTVGLVPGVDIRADGGYVAAPPSVDYEVAVGCELAPLPDSVLALLDKPKPELVNLEGEIPEGQRTTYLVKVAGMLKRKGLAPKSIEQALTQENMSRCNPPLDCYEVLNIARSAEKWIAEDPILAPLESNPPESLVIKPSDLADETLEFLADKEKVKGEPTGIDGLDRLLGGGKRLGEVTCWHAEAKVGKNALWHKLMFEFSCVRGIPIGYASRELSPEVEVIPNLLSLTFKENAWKSELTEKRKLYYREALDVWPIYFAKGYGYFPFDTLVTWVKELKALGVSYFWFDHLHYMVEDPEDHRAASKLVKDLKSLARTEDIHIDVIIQPNKLMEGQKLSLNSIKGGAAMGQAIDNLLTLERVRDETNLSRLSLKAGRSRLCVPGEIYLKYDTDTTDFNEQAESVKKDPGPVYSQRIG